MSVTIILFTSLNSCLTKYRRSANITEPNYRTENDGVSKLVSLRQLFLILILFTVCFWCQSEVDRIKFNNDIRPILAKNCFACHGPDSKQRQANLRLDQYQGAIAKPKGLAAIVPNKPSESQLMTRITTNDERKRMPPPKHGTRLTTKEIEQLRQWIKEGANYDKHWSYIKPKRPQIPSVTDANWCRNPIDYFVQSQLEAIGLLQESVADRWSCPSSDSCINDSCLISRIGTN